MNPLSKLVILFSIVILLGCKKNDPEPASPVIKFLDAQFSPDKTFVTVRFDFFDNDGDLGLLQNENTGNQSFNIFIDYYEKNNGVWKLISPIATWNPTEAVYDSSELNLRLPFIENDAGRALEGEAQIDLLYNFNADTFRYDITLMDRAFQLSNVITTSELILD